MPDSEFTIPKTFRGKLDQVANSTFVHQCSMPTVSKPASNMSPIFILGILRRSGTNFLHNLLCLHPDCEAPAIVAEDFLTANADLLGQYIDSVYGAWDPGFRAGVDENFKAAFYQHIGNGLVSFLATQTDGRRLVTKTPSVRSLNCFFTLFPRAHLIIIVRDGRAVVESGVKGFGWNYEAAMHRWAYAARTILEFDKANKNSEFRYLIVKYEDLYSQCEVELRRILAFLELDITVYDFQAALNLPVSGSSIFGAIAKESVHWEPVKKTPNFNPLSRWNHWSRNLHERFNWLAGQYLTQLGYEQQRCSTNTQLWSAWNKALDVKWRVLEFKQNLQAGFKAVRRRLS